jgi:hypothetical protein
MGGAEEDFSAGASRITGQVAVAVERSCDEIISALARRFFSDNVAAS